MHFLNRDVVRGKILRAVLRQSQFVVSFAGTSVTAGHDNFLNQSFPLVFHREANSSFAAAGVDLVVRNHAMGNNPAIPASFCLGSQLGSDTDVAVWEFGMMVGGDSRNGYVELWMRNAIALPKQPALMLLDPGEGARKPDGDGNLPTVRVGQSRAGGGRGQAGRGRGGGRGLYVRARRVERLMYGLLSSAAFVSRGSVAVSRTCVAGCLATCPGASWTSTAPGRTCCTTTGTSGCTHRSDRQTDRHGPWLASVGKPAAGPREAGPREGEREGGRELSVPVCALERRCWRPCGPSTPRSPTTSAHW